MADSPSVSDNEDRQMRTVVIPDERSGKVVFLAHCLLNENVRYAGGAFRRGVVDEVVDEVQRHGWGIVQMPCPEQLAWGGVRKRYLSVVYGSRGSLAYRVRRPLLALALGWTAIRADLLARSIVRQIEDYQRSGMTIVGIVGVGPSPSCGVRTTLGIRCAVDVLGRCPLAMNRGQMNEELLVGCRVTGQGLFIRALRRRLARRGLAVPFFEHDLVRESHDRGGAYGTGVASADTICC